MPLIDLAGHAQALTAAWSSCVLGEIGPARIKVLRMDRESYAEESHAYNEALIVIEGKLELEIAGEQITVAGGQMYVVPSGTPHLVRDGSHGVLMIVDI